MGDRANIKFIEEYGGELYLYTHWGGSQIKVDLANALERGRSRWDDGQYLARIIFNGLSGNIPEDTAGFGISTYLGDGADQVLEVNMNNQQVKDWDGRVYTFEEFVYLYQEKS